MSKVICISGHAQNGKDTTASILKNVFEKDNKSAIIIHYADLLKYLCKQYFGWDGNKDEYGRTILQHIGTDIIRKKEPNYWVNFIKSFINLFYEEFDYFIIADARFPNEIDLIKTDFDVKHIRVIRENFKSPLSEEQQKHISEIALDNYSADLYIYNNGSIEDLTKNIEYIKDFI